MLVELSLQQHLLSWCFSGYGVGTWTLASLGEGQSDPEEFNPGWKGEEFDG